MIVVNIATCTKLSTVDIKLNLMTQKPLAFERLKMAKKKVTTRFDIDR